MQDKADLKGRAVSALRALFIGDALAMPVHWFYNTEAIDQAFPEGIDRFYAAPAFHPTTIMGRPLPADSLVG